MSTSVLLVDDEEEFVTTLAERLETRGLSADVATCGEEALERVGQSSYDAVLLDLAMPGMDGLETLERLLERKPDTQVILLTGHATVKKCVKAMRAGALDFLEKPVDIEEVAAKIQEAAENKEQLTLERIDRDIDDLLRKRGW